MKLDSRYFKGLEGQYWFQLHFRLDKEGEHDYIVRSHGNYSMRRSVSTDLELDPGTYSVLMKITAKRYKDDPTPEDVIRTNVRSRQNKLIQVGLSYDLAHAKGEIRETVAERKERKAHDEKKKVAGKRKQRELKRKQLLADYEFEKRKRARDKRQTQKKVANEAKKAARAKSTEQAEGNTAADESSKVVNGTNAAAGVEGEVEKQAAASATEDKTGEPAPDPATLPSPPAETETKGQKPSKDNSAEANDVAKEEKQAEEAPSHDDGVALKAQSFEQALKSMPSVTVNGEPAPAGSVQAPQSEAARSALAPDDDYQYDSDASFDSSIDSVLDFPREALDDDEVAPTDDGLPPIDDGEENKEFEDDPWNAVCVVGLRVYSKNRDADCCVEVVRPKQVEETLDLDDASKGASGEVEGKTDVIPTVKVEEAKS